MCPNNSDCLDPNLFISFPGVAQTHGWGVCIWSLPKLYYQVFQERERRSGKADIRTISSLIHFILFVFSEVLYNLVLKTWY